MGKVVLITGATSGIGQMCAEKLAVGGYQVLGIGRRVNPGDDNNLAYNLLRCDINDQESVDNCINQIILQKRRIDVLVNCAGFGFGGAVEDMTVEESKEQFETNFFGTHRVIRAVMPIMRKQKSGTIITISSMASEFVIPFQSFYSSSKMALDGMMQAVRMEGKDFGIKAACINPGDIRTGFTAARRQAKAFTPQSAYYEGTRYSIDKMKNDEMQGITPDVVADLVCRLVEKDKLKSKYYVEPKYKMFMLIKRFLPDSLVEKILIGTYMQSK